MDTNLENEKLQAKRRFQLALYIITPSLIILLIISLIMLYRTEVDPDTIFTALIGLIGTWVGTILAFYYSKDNFDAASKSTQDLIDRVTSADKLNTISAGEAMLQLTEITHLRIENGKEFKDYKIEELLVQYFDKGNRLPVLNSDGYPALVIHRSMVDKYLAEIARKGKEVQDLTLEDLINSNYGSMIKLGFGTVKSSDSLTVVKSLMENLTTDDVICSDIFITEKGNKTSSLVGWITNSMIAEKSTI